MTLETLTLIIRVWMVISIVLIVIVLKNDILPDIKNMWKREGEDNPNDEEIARLIAAAPEMLKVLERVNRFMTNGIECGYIYIPDKILNDPATETPEIVRRIIAKAKGELE